MRTYTVHEPPGGHAGRLEQAEALVFVREGFSWAAALLAPFWMIAHGLWLALIIYIAGSAALQVGMWAVGAGESVQSWVMIAVHLLIGFEADSIRRWTLARRGYTTIASVNGQTDEACERRFFELWLKDQSFLPAPVAPGSARGPAVGRLDAGTFGLRRS